MTADEYDIGGTTSPADRTRSGDGPVVGGEAGNGAASTPNEQFDADRGATADRPIRDFGIVVETPPSTRIEESLYV